MDEQTQKYIEAYERLEYSAKLHKPMDFQDPLLALTAGKMQGTPLAFEPRIAFRRGEVTVWASSNGSGKSLLTGQIALQFGDIGLRSAILSFEMSPERTLLRMMRQRLDHKPTPEDVEPFLKSINNKITLLNYRGAIHENVVFGAMAVAAQEWQCHHIFIDNLMKVVHGDDDYNAQKDFVEKCTTYARLLGVHVHIIHHTKKLGTEDDEINKFSVKGSGAIIDLVDNAILIQRNRKKERDIEEGRITAGGIADLEEADSVLRVVKQRNGDFEGGIPLWFDPETTAFCPNGNRIPLWVREQ